jgi:aminoglycoside phosphotransferase (APT) family kinase protein
MFELLVQTIAPRSRLVRTWPLEGGISAQMTALEVEDPAGRRRKYILRQPGEAALAQNPRAARDEFQVLQIARAAGLAAPAPCLLDVSGQIFPAPYLVVEYIEGRMDFAPQDPAPQDPAGTGRPTAVAQMAAQLARIHRVDGARHDLSFLAKPAAGFDEMFGRLPAAVDPAFDGWRLRETLQAAWPFPRQNGAALLHGDYWPGNVLWRDGSLAAVIDWEDAALGEPLTDLAIARLDLLWIFGPEAMHAFTRHYLASNPIDTAALPHWDLAAAWRLARMAGADLAGWAAFFAPFGRPDITASSILEHYRDFVRQAQEVLMA